MNISLTQDMSFIALVIQASWVVKGVILLLLFASVVSWWLIFEKMFTLRRESREAETFEKEFWGGGHSKIVQRADEDDRGSSLEEVFRAGWREFRGKRQLGAGSEHVVVESARRAMRAAYQREMDQAESHLPFLATVGSVSPYIGLFGTVWGIMNAFLGLSNVAQTTLAQVAPGIAEALIATAVGLFAAIPAVIAYNRFTHDIDRLANRYDVFMEEFSNILQQEAARS